jgi:hypothetical protein
MHWAAVFLTAYAAGFLEIWRLCDQAPSAPEDSDVEIGPAR